MRTKLRSKVTLLFMVLGMLLAVPTVAFAADLLTEAELSSDINARTEVAPNDTSSFNVKVWARGNINANNANATGKADVVNAYTMAANGTISAGTSKTTLQFNKGHNYGADGQTCPASVAAQPAGVTGKGCASDPFIVPATLAVGNATAGTNGTLTVSVTGSEALGNTTPTATCSTSSTVNDPNTTPDATDCTRDQGFVTVAVTNNDPTVSDPAADASGNEGDTLTADGAFSDADGDTLTIIKQSGAGEVDGDNGDGTWSWSLATTDQTSGSVTVRATDPDGAFAEDTFTYNAANVAPTATFNSPDVNEGSNISLSLTNKFDPAGANDTLSYAFDCGDGNGYGAFGSSDTASCPTTDNGTRSVGAKISDEDGGVNEYTDSVTISNVAPTATFNSPDVNEGSNINLSLTSPFDPSSADTTAGFQYAFDCDTDDAAGYSAFSATSTANCATTDNGTRNVGAKIQDKDGGVTTYTDSVTISNVVPVVGDLSVTSSTNRVACLTGGNTVTLENFSFTDAGSADTHKALIEWGDGKTDTVDPAVSPEEDLQHTYESGLLGPFTIKVTVTDDDGGSGTKDNSTNQLSFHYNIGSTMLSPVNADSTSIFKVGSTIPVKVNITDCSGAGVSGLAPTIKMLKISSNPASQGEVEVISTQPNDTNGVMRDLGNGLYMYNLASSSLPDSTAMYKSVITHNGYSVTSTNFFSLKAK